MPPRHRSEFTESTFAFSFVRELIDDAFVPEFASTRAEGADGGGWDVRIDTPVLPAYYQFKIVREMVGGGAKQYPQYMAPYLRFKLRTGYDGKPDQHSLLLDLQNAGAGTVYYAAPRFIELAELLRAAGVDNVIGCSIRLSLARLHPSDPHEQHYMTFLRNGSNVIQWSEPQQISLPTQTDGDGRALPVEMQGVEALTVGELIERVQEWIGGTVQSGANLPDGAVPGRLRALAEAVRMRTGCVLALHRPSEVSQ